MSKKVHDVYTAARLAQELVVAGFNPSPLADPVRFEQLSPTAMLHRPLCEVLHTDRETVGVYVDLTNPPAKVKFCSRCSDQLPITARARYVTADQLVKMAVAASHHQGRVAAADPTLESNLPKLCGNAAGYLAGLASVDDGTVPAAWHDRIADLAEVYQDLAAAAAKVAARDADRVRRLAARDVISSSGGRRLRAVMAPPAHMSYPVVLTGDDPAGDVPLVRAAWAEFYRLCETLHPVDAARQVLADAVGPDSVPTSFSQIPAVPISATGDVRAAAAAAWRAVAGPAVEAVVGHWVQRMTAAMNDDGHRVIATNLTRSSRSTFARECLDCGDAASTGDRTVAAVPAVVADWLVRFSPRSHGESSITDLGPAPDMLVAEALKTAVTLWAAGGPTRTPEAAWSAAVNAVCVGR